MSTSGCEVWQALAFVFLPYLGYLTLMFLLWVYAGSAGDVDRGAA
jgi:hypothetical protein